MMGCSGDDVSTADSGSNMNVEGDYAAILKFTQLEIDVNGNGGNKSMLNDELEGTYSISIDGEKMVFRSIDDDSFTVEGIYDLVKKEFIGTRPVKEGYKDGVLMLKFYEEDGIVRALGEYVVEHIETGGKDIISIELSKEE